MVYNTVLCLIVKANLFPSSEYISKFSDQINQSSDGISSVMEYKTFFFFSQEAGFQDTLDPWIGCMVGFLFQPFFWGMGSMKSYILSLQIIFEAIRGVSIRSDMAIDDILFQAGPCLGKFNFIFPRRHLASHIVFFVLTQVICCPLNPHWMICI